MDEIISEIIELQDGSKRKRWKVSSSFFFDGLYQSYLIKGDLAGSIDHLGNFLWYIGSDSGYYVEYFEDMQYVDILTLREIEIDITKFPDATIFIPESCTIYFPLFSYKHIKPAVRNS